MDNKIEVQFLPLEKCGIIHAVTISKTGVNGRLVEGNIYYWRDPREYPRVDQQPQDGNSFEQSQACEEQWVDDFDRLLLEAVRTRYQNAQASCKKYLFNVDADNVKFQLENNLSKVAVRFLFLPIVKVSDMQLSTEEKVRGYQYFMNIYSWRGHEKAFEGECFVTYCDEPLLDKLENVRCRSLEEL